MRFFQCGFPLFTLFFKLLLGILHLRHVDGDIDTAATPASLARAPAGPRNQQLGTLRCLHFLVPRLTAWAPASVSPGSGAQGGSGGQPVVGRVHHRSSQSQRSCTARLASSRCVSEPFRSLNIYFTVPSAIDRRRTMVKFHAFDIHSLTIFHLIHHYDLLPSSCGQAQ